MWISRKEFEEMVRQTYTANVILQSYKQMEEQSAKLEKECYDLKWKLTDAKAKCIQQEQQNRLLVEEIDHLKQKLEYDKILR
ncbi:MAG: hypothetical protein HDQ88_03855 [Clostridia bacterium]|nr:hypothetical protein [Clostridia bacterium]